jgi:DeoR family fructose operon transcriptional repressor
MSKPLIPAQRHLLIREYLDIHHIARNADLSEMLGASEATIRRDLEVLESQRIVERTHGGAVLTQRMPTEPAYSHSALAHPEEKRWIGQAAAALVRDGQTVLVNSGTTTADVLRYLRSRKDIARLVIITNNIMAAMDDWDPAVELLLLGGSFRSRSHSVVGRFATDMLRQVGADVSFIGVDGISLKYGVTTPSNVEAEIAQLMIERTRGRVVIVADHSKWGVVSNFDIATIDQIHALVVDSGLPAASRAELEARGVEVVVAGPRLANGSAAPPADPPENHHAPVRQESP